MRGIGALTTHMQTHPVRLEPDPAAEAADEADAWASPAEVWLAMEGRRLSLPVFAARCKGHESGRKQSGKLHNHRPVSRTAI